MSLTVVDVGALQTASIVAHIACERQKPGVNFLVSNEIRPGPEVLSADLADEWPFACVRSNVIFQTCPRGENLVAVLTKQTWALHLLMDHTDVPLQYRLSVVLFPACVARQGFARVNQ